MRLLQEAIRTYDAYQDIAGVYEEKRSPLVPVSHALKRLDIVVTVNEDGDFIKAVDISKDGFRAIIPTTKESSVRTANVAPHALCDGLTYLGRYDKKGGEDYKRNDAYKELLDSWARSPYSVPLVEAVNKYIEKDELINDLASSEVIELDDKGCPKKDSVIGWILMTKDEEIRCWDDRKIMENWQKFVLSTFDEKDKIICMLTGEPDYYWSNHTKGVVPGCDANAKLISQDYTDNKFKSRFVCKENRDGHEDVVLGYVSSQKAHNALKWMLSNFAVTKNSIGTHRDILCWSPTQVDMINPVESILKRTDADDENIETAVDVDSYKELLRKVILGYNKNDDGTEDYKDVIIASFDGMTPGRVAVTYYAEMKASLYFSKLLKWDEECCYYHNRFGVVSPSISTIVRYAYGQPMENKTTKKMMMDIKTDILTRDIQTLLSCKLEGKKFPQNIKHRLVTRAGRPDAYDHFLWERFVQLACAVIRKSRKDMGLEEYSMKLEEDRIDKDYLFGRLMAVLEKVENDTFKDKKIERCTNIERLWASIEINPLRNLKRIFNKQKSAYYPKLTPPARVFYERLIGDIFDKLMEYPEKTLNRKLTETYLLGYYAQKNALYQKRSKGTGDSESSEETEK